VTSYIIYASLVCLVALGLASFTAEPRYEKGVWVVLMAVSNCLSAALGAKFGLAQPNTKPHDTLESDVEEPEK
jgi:hypothetical protein